MELTRQYTIFQITNKILKQAITIVNDPSVFKRHPFRGHKIWSRKNAKIIFVFYISSFEETPLFRERDTFSGSQNLGLTSTKGTP